MMLGHFPIDSHRSTLQYLHALDISTSNQEREVIERFHRIYCFHSCICSTAFFLTRARVQFINNSSNADSVVSDKP